jgi:hypothetical protein
MEATSPISPPSQPELSGVAAAFNATDQLGRHRAHRPDPDARELSSFDRATCSGRSQSHPKKQRKCGMRCRRSSTRTSTCGAARVQFIHYNIIHYRLAELERMLGPWRATAISASTWRSRFACVSWPKTDRFHDWTWQMLPSSRPVGLNTLSDLTGGGSVAQRCAWGGSQ